MTRLDSWFEALYTYDCLIQYPLLIIELEMFNTGAR